MEPQHALSESQSGPIAVLYEDNHVIAVVKPPGVPTQADESNDPDLLTLVRADLKSRHNKPGNVFLGLVHRLDRPVGGVMVFAKTSKAASRLSDAIRTRAFAKSYIAVTEAIPARAEATLKHYLLKDEKRNTVAAFTGPRDGAKEAVLEYSVISASGGRALTAVRLHTGRPHQIRVQLASIGAAIVGDRKYGKDAEAQEEHASTALWSAYIGVQHPVTKDWMEFRALPSRAGAWARWSAEDLQAAGSRYTDTMDGQP
jgi:23S rRNA pseudouridine1911/1915/1917 synthase